MVVNRAEILSEPRYAGLRMSADEYLALQPDGCRYELVDGVVIVSPSPLPNHQLVAGEIVDQVRPYVRTQKLGVVLQETDVQLSKGAAGRQVVYRPEIMFLRAAHVPKIKGRITVVPDLIVEVISPGYRSYDTVTKRADYEAAGVGEYWIVDPQLEEFLFLRLIDGKYVEAAASGDWFESTVVDGFKLDLKQVREAFGQL